MSFRNAALVSAMIVILPGCSSMKPEDFANTEPKFEIEEYFLGKTTAWGIFEDRFGNLRRQFTVDIDGTMEGKTLVLDERFQYADGETDRRIWRIERIDEHTYEGRADDIIGSATGVVYGNALQWSYDMDLKVGDRSWRVAFNDWMFLQPGGALINRAAVTKWGITLGEVTLFFKKEPAEETATQTADQTVQATNAPQLAAE